jgi:hypothetical protein
MSVTPIRPDPQRAERNLRTLVRFGPPYTLQVYGQDVVDILGELDRCRAAATAALEHENPATPTAMRAAAAGMARG